MQYPSCRVLGSGAGTLVERTDTTATLALVVATAAERSGRDVKSSPSTAMNTTRSLAVSVPTSSASKS